MLLLSEPFDLSHLNSYQPWQESTIFFLRSDKKEIYFLFLLSCTLALDHTARLAQECPSHGKGGVSMFLMDFTQWKRVNLVNLFSLLEYQFHQVKVGVISGLRSCCKDWQQLPSLVVSKRQNRIVMKCPISGARWLASHLSCLPTSHVILSKLLAFLLPSASHCKVGVTMIMS